MKLLTAKNADVPAPPGLSDIVTEFGFPEVPTVKFEAATVPKIPVATPLIVPVNVAAIVEFLLMLMVLFKQLIVGVLVVPPGKEIAVTAPLLVSVAP